MPDAAADPRFKTLIEVTSIPTATGREWRVVEYLRAWVAARPALRLDADKAGNLVVRAKKATGGATKAKRAPLFITAHLDHPAFVVERVIAPGVVELSFRGGVMDVFFKDAPLTLHTRDGRRLPAILTRTAERSSPLGKHYEADVLESASADDEAAVAVGDVATWALLPAEVDGDGVLHTPACDDLAAVAAALDAMDALIQSGGPRADVRLLFTLAEEIGFIGAIAACRLKTIPKGARVVALENSRASAEAPVGGGPIVRVGDRLSVFTPWLTAACAARAEGVFGAPSTPRASQTNAEVKARPWQRKLMSGGACEASVFCHAGFDATCLCLPLGNYHNMAHLTELQEGRYDAAKHGPARCAREFIHTLDYVGLVDLLVEIATKGVEPADSGVGKLVEKLYAEKGFVLGVGVGAKTKRSSTKAAKRAKAGKSLARKR